MKAAIFLIALTAAAQNQTGGLTGVVVDSVTHQPVKKASVQVNHIGTFRGRPQGSSSAITDAAGAFAINNVPAGQARIIVKPFNHPQWQPGKTVDIKPGETAGPVTVELVPDASISGHVVDEDGDPLTGCFVHPHPAENVQRDVPEQGLPTSNLEGEYRLSGIPPGRYILSIDCQQPVFEPRPFSAGPDPPPSHAYPPEFYPSVTDAKAAQVLDLTPGVEKEGVDFEMKPVAVTQVRGTFSGDLWQGRQNLGMQLVNVESTSANRANFANSIDMAKGTFEFRKVYPGSYLLMGFSNNNGAIGFLQRVEVKDRPVETVVEWRRATDISGTVEMETHGSETISPSSILVSLAPDLGPGPMGSPQTRVGDDGTFTLKSVLPGLWRIHAQGPSVFLKSAWSGTDDITSHALDSSGGAAGPLRLVVSNNTATVRGTGPPGENVFMIVAQGGGMSFEGMPIDQNGQFTWTNLAPGKYRFVAADAVPGAFRGDEGTEVTVGEGETVTVDLKN